MYNDRFNDPKIIIIFQKLSWSNNLLLVNNYSRKERLSRNDRKNIVVTVRGRRERYPGTHRNFENLGTAGYRVPGEFLLMPTPVLVVNEIRINF